MDFLKLSAYIKRTFVNRKLLKNACGAASKRHHRKKNYLINNEK